MGIKIFGGENEQKKKNKFADDVVGRFRSGYQENDRPVALSDWRVTTGDPEVADAVIGLMGGDEPKEWETKGEDNLEIFTDRGTVQILLDGPKAVRQDLVMYGRKGLIYVSDGETITYPDERKGEPDPQAGQTLAERKNASREGTGADPRIVIFFRLAENPDLGVFKFQSGSWSMLSDLDYNDVEQEISDIHADTDGGQIAASLSLEVVEFTAKNGPRAGQKVSYTKPVLNIQGAAA